MLLTSLLVGFVLSHFASGSSSTDSDKARFEETVRWFEWLSNSLSGEDETSGDNASRKKELPLFFRLSGYLRMLPLDDLRFVAFLALFFTVAAFIGNLLTQHEHESEQDDLDRETSEHHVFSLTALHLLQTEQPKWVNQGLVERMIETVRTELALKGSSEASQQDDGSIAVDSLLLLQYCKSRGVDQENEVICHAFRSNIDEVARSQALEYVQILRKGPKVFKNLLVTTESFSVVVDYLTSTVLVCVKDPSCAPVRDLLELYESVMTKDVEVAMCGLAVNENSLEKDAPKCPEMIAKRAWEIFQRDILGEQKEDEKEGEKSLRISRVMAEKKGFRCRFTGHGLAGSVACALAFLVRSAHATGKAAADPNAGEWLSSDAASHAHALVFGSVPCFAMASDVQKYSEVCTTIAVKGDLVPRFSPRNCRSLAAYFQQVRFLTPAGERLASLFKHQLNSIQLTQVLEDICDKVSGLVTADDKDTLSLTHPGKVLYISNENKWHEMTRQEFAQLPLVGATGNLLQEHDLSCYEKCLRVVSND